jgi:hypothetical protein
MMILGRKGQEKFGYLLIFGTFIALIVFVLIAANTGAGGGLGALPADPSSVAQWYSKVIRGEGLPEENKALAIVFSIFVPFLASFSMLWALLLLMPIFQGYQSRNAASVLAFGMSLYALPMMSFIFASFLPYGLAFAGVMIVIGIIIISIRFVSGPALGLAGETGRDATDAKRAWQSYSSVSGPSTAAGRILIDPAIYHGLTAINERLRDMTP